IPHSRSNSADPPRPTAAKSFPPSELLRAMSWHAVSLCGSRSPGPAAALDPVDMDTLAQDFRYAVRQLARTPAFTMVAVLTLAVGIGANASLFTLANSVFARPAPGVNNDGRLVWIAPFSTRGG